MSDRNAILNGEINGEKTKQEPAMNAGPSRLRSMHIVNTYVRERDWIGGGAGSSLILTVCSAARTLLQVNDA